mgnify:CR=1 FL=1|tara:strand:+ start:871 stop:1470 length:600 start_codon:yes stop_codon:yes gene_type:complete
MAGVTIKNPGTGQQAFVSSDGQLRTQSESLSTQHFVSRYRGQSYQAVFEDTGLGAAANVVAHIKNTSSTLSLVMTHIALQVIDVAGGTALGNTDLTYWSLAFDRTYASGGALTTPVNMNRGSGNAADVITYDTNPTLAGTAVEYDKVFVSGTHVERFSKEAALILSPGSTCEFTLTTDHTSGTAHARATFMMMDLSDVI